MKTILVTGASSYIGARIFFDLKNTYNLIGTTYLNHHVSEDFIHLNLTLKSRVDALIKNLKPDIILHVANYSNLNFARMNKKKFINLNQKTTQYLVRNANLYGLKVIFISSLAAKNPDNIYSKLKVKSETMVKTVQTGYLILRPALVIGLSPNTMSNKFFNQILKCLNNEDKPAQFDISWKIQPTYIGHLAQIINHAISNNEWNKTIPVYIDKRVTKYQLATDILRFFRIFVYPTNLHTNFLPIEDDLTHFRSLSLAPASYEDMVRAIVKEIKQRQIYSLARHR